tara:strand:- start:6505 stop:7014 length:510 start_codon:yes stop_codon:yes gene_type:complete
MTTYKITFKSAGDTYLGAKGAGLYQRIETKPEQKRTNTDGSTETTRAEYTYVPAKLEFTFDSSDAYDSGSEVFAKWLEIYTSEAASALTDSFNVEVEQETKTYDVSYSKRYDALITAEVCDSYDLHNEHDVETWLEDNGDYELHPDETGEYENITVDVSGAGEYVPVEW